ncbi:gamma-tubulin complex component 4 isoform X2 [Frankliniella occidentalis]|uniref:Gamma-tubulin complex component n=1 Tax=Frankliniella occidentalis TaxID=133901 RepID=A0A9C6X7Q4_FRAOC|nr:gamma-tubulin complex component 4 isoform X1 [Frankliniella occidentalis]XP_052130699.1 gamma-tubulin complex component 4 isoform X2 [Frankliniella occidentalis]
MLHELLFSLYGFPGGLLDKGNDMVEVASFLHPGERALIKKILSIASEYKQLKEYVDLYKNDKRVLKPLNIQDDDSKVLRPGLYLQAFFIGIDEALAPYRSEIVDLESRLLADPQCSLQFVLTRVSPYSVVFSTLNALIREVAAQKLHGCQLLQLLYQNLLAAVEEVQVTLEKLLHQCHSVFFKQLSSWVLHGVLKDSFHEFFIQPVEKTNTQSSYCSYLEYKICPELLPSYIPYSLGNKVLFIGQSIVMLSNDPRDQNTDTTCSASILGRNNVNNALWNECGHRYNERLGKLNQSFLLDIGLFDETIEIIRSFITEKLWELAVEQAQLPMQLRLIKDMFLLGRGELFLEFIKEAGGILDRTPSSTFKRDINQAFHSAAHKILLSSEEAKIEKFYFSAIDKNPSGSADVDNGWTALVLKYHVSWPLHLVFTPDVLDSYNQLFGFLLRVKKTQRQLHHLWTFQMIKKSQRWQDSRIWKVRTWLMFIVDHLQYYLQVDVLESQWNILENALEATRDFEALRHAHMNFLASTLSQTFLLLGSSQNEPTTTSYQKPDSLKNNPVHNSLSILLKLCERFCSCVASWGEMDMTIDQEDELTLLCRELDHLVSFLLQLLSSLRDQPCGTHLAQLLLRLDFNRWFSRQCAGSSLTGSLTGSIT